MILRLALALATATLVAGPDEGTPAQPVQWGRQGQDLLAAGRILGAATMCRHIPEARINAAADKISAIVDKSVKTNAEVDGARATFRTGAAAGRDAIKSGRFDCVQADVALKSMERDLQQ
jgi:hypothetical protein